MEEDWEEGMGESSFPPPRSALHFHDLKRRVYDRLLQTHSRSGQALSDEPAFRLKFDRHLERLPNRYLFDLGVDKAEDVPLHWKILADCADPEKRPVFYARFQKYATAPPDCDAEFDPCQRLMEDLSLERRKDGDNTGSMSISSRDSKTILLHEIIFSSLDKPKLLSRLTALLSEVGLNIREAHVYSTIDGFCLDVFVVDGWETEETNDLITKIKETLTRINASPSNSTNSSASEKILELQQQVGDSEIDWNLLTMGEEVASGSSADLYQGTYNGIDVAIKMLRIAHFNNPSEVEFLQEILILRSVNHENVLQFYGACTRPPKYCIVTEYMPGGNLYDFLHKQNNILDLLAILNIAISIAKGMDYLHRNNIIHRDLKTANLLMGYHQVVKIADFGVARHGGQEGQMTAETGTYRWMAPEVPYDDMTPLQAALGVRQGFRLEIPSSVHPRLSKLIRQCWDEDPDVRPVFAEIMIELEDILQNAQANRGASRRSRAKMQKKSPR
ncbi:hypothetical protein ABZP36_025781 [Zizania latifolia]